MSAEEQQQENGTTNGGDVPEIELIIKVKWKNFMKKDRGENYINHIKYM